MASTEWEPGTVAIATVRGVKDVRVIKSHHEDGREYYWWTANRRAMRSQGFPWLSRNDVTDVRPLVVLDLNGLLPPHVLAAYLRATGVSGSFAVGEVLADQIEAQTKPPRIPEPEVWGVVNAQRGGDDLMTRKWVRYGTGWRDAFGNFSEWEDLIDPVLIREGVSE